MHTYTDRMWSCTSNRMAFWISEQGKESDKARKLLWTSIYQSSHRFRFVSAVTTAALSSTSSISRWKADIQLHIALWQYNSHWIFTASSVFSFLQRTKTICQYSIFTLLIFSFFCSCEMGQDGSVGTADTDHELNGQMDRDSIAGRSSYTLCSIYRSLYKAFVHKKRLNWLALLPLKAQIIL
jgi:hypothetical protein